MRDDKSHQAGWTLIELLVVVSVIGLMSLIAVSQGEMYSNALKAGTDGFVGITKTARTYAMSTTTPHRVVPISDSSIRIDFGGPCGDPAATWTPLAGEEFELPRGTRLSTTSWEVCFTTRGWATDVHEVRLLEGNSYQDMSVLLGGSVRVGPVHRNL